MHSHWLAPRPAPYAAAWQAMQAFTQQRDAYTPDEIWLTEHEPVYTLGLGGKPEHLLDTGAVPVVQTDRGGQVTYHGPGQVVAYVLFDLKRAGYYIKEYVHRVEAAVISLLEAQGIDACRQPGAPGVYVPMRDDAGRLAKVAALGIKVKNGCTYHGVALNVAMDLKPFQGINPCGYAGLRTVDLAACGVQLDIDSAGALLAARLGQHLQR